MIKKEIKEERREKNSSKNEGHALKEKVQTAEGWRRTHENKSSAKK